MYMLLCLSRCSSSSRIDSLLHRALSYVIPSTVDPYIESHFNPGAMKGGYLDVVITLLERNASIDENLPALAEKYPPILSAL